MGEKNTAKGVPNPHLHARVSYLYQAANYLSSQATSSTQQIPASSGDGPCLQPQWYGQEAKRANRASAKNTSRVDQNDPADEAKLADKEPKRLGLSQRHIAHMRATALKSQVRLSREVKMPLCKRCDTLLVPGNTSQSSIENRSKGGKKPWADVYVIECLVCGTQKRFPTGSKRQRKGRLKKTSDEPEKPENDASIPAAMRNAA